MAGIPDVRGLAGVGRCLVMGVLNVTPDSFSDGGAWLDPDRAVTHGLDMLADGADVIDVGGESTRPGADRVPAAEELRRTEPVVAALAAAGAVVSIDTARAVVAERALAAGARLVNDVSGGVADPGMLPLVAAAGCLYIVMHGRGASRDMLGRARYDDVVGEVCAELAQRLDAAHAAGVDPDQLIIDPGLGFAKTAEHNWALLAHLGALLALGRPVLIGASRKAFLGRLLGAGPEDPRPAVDRDDATTALTAYAALHGGWGVRVHAVRPSADAVRVAARLRAAR